MIRELFERYKTAKKDIKECNKEISEYSKQYVEVVEKYLNTAIEYTNFNMDSKILRVDGVTSYSDNFYPIYILIKSKLGFEINVSFKYYIYGDLINGEKIAELVNAIRELDDKLINEIETID